MIESEREREKDREKERTREREEREREREREREEREREREREQTTQHSSGQTEGYVGNVAVPAMENTIGMHRNSIFTGFRKACYMFYVVPKP